MRHSLTSNKQSTDIMQDEERYLKKELGNRLSFIVPDEYFKDLTERTMYRISHEDERAKAGGKNSHAIRWMATAACFAAVCFTSLYYVRDLHQKNDMKQLSCTTTTANHNQVYEESWEQVADNAMTDEQEYYYYLSDH